MERRRLGHSDLEVSRFGLGAMVLGQWGNRDRAECVRILRAALDAGVNLVDTADMYAQGENEEIVGEALRGRRDDVILATKFHHQMGDDPHRSGNSRRWIMEAVEDSLRRLGVDHIDVYQAHRPDPSVPLEETVEALSDLVESGKIRHWGTSTFPAEEIVAAHWGADRVNAVPPATEQPPYSILCRGIEAAVLPTCRRLDMGVLVWSPLSGGWLTGKHRRGVEPDPESRATTNPDHFDGDNPAKFDAVERLSSLAGEAGLSLTHMALAWTVTHPDVTCALLGPRTMDQLVDLLGASEVELSDDVLDAIDEIVPPGTNLNPADVGWIPPGLSTRSRRGSPP